MRYFTGLKLSLAALLLSGSLSAGVIFQDSFPDSGGVGVEEPQGLGIVTGTLDLLKWDVVSGSVDVLDTFQTVVCGAPSGKRCLDINGSTGQTGRIQTTAQFNFVSGNRYTLFAYVAGSGRAASASDSARISLGNLGATTVTLAHNAAWQQVMLGEFVGNGSTGRIVIDGGFTGADADNIGLLFDDIQLIETTAADTTPEPATLALIGLGLAALGVARRK